MMCVSCVTKGENNLKVVGGMGGLYNPDDVRVANGAFFDLGFESEKKYQIPVLLCNQYVYHNAEKFRYII